MAPPFRPIKERLEKYSLPEPNTGCLIWLGKIDKYGYGSVWFNGKQQLAHRVAYETAIGPIPDQLDHLCRVRCCVNPDHLEPVSGSENMRRSPVFMNKPRGSHGRFVCRAD
jgi:hypothetical protein